MFAEASAATRLAEQLVELAAALYDRGITPGRTGNLSVAVEDRILMSPTDSCLGRLDPARLSVLDRGGRHVGGDRPSKELSLHLALYERGAHAVAHVHSTYAVAISCLADRDLDEPIAPLTAYYAMRVGRLPLLPYHPPGDPALAEAIRATPPDVRCALLANHGSIAAGSTLDAAVDAVEEIEETARLALLLHGRRTAPIGAAEAARLRTTYS